MKRFFYRHIAALPLLAALYCTQGGIIVQGGVVDLTGVHHGSGGNPNLPGDGDGPGLNSIYNNAGAQISVSSSSANVWVYQNDYPSTWMVAGENNIYQGTGSSIFIEGPGTGTSGNPSVDISNNYWGGIIPPGSSPDAYNWVNFNFSASGATSQSSNSGIDCSDEDDYGTKGNGSQKKVLAGGSDTCSVRFPTYALELESDYQWKEAYDTMRYWYIPHCYSIADPQSTAGALAGSVQIPENIDSMDSLLNYRQFLIHCLTLRKDAGWFCAFVADLAATYKDSNAILTPDYRAARAIDLYLLSNPRCAAGYSGDSTDYAQLTQSQRNLWEDTAHSGSFDTSVPTMQQLGLDTVLEINADDGVSYDIQTSTILLDARLEGNPTDADALLWLSIGREAWLNISVYNVLGQQVPNSGFAGVFEQGTREVPLNVGNAPPGVYYVRIQTANNETETLKLIKE